MEYQDEMIASLKNRKRVHEHSDIKGAGIYTNKEFVKFNKVELFSSINMYLLEDFIDMPDRIITMKYPSTNRPQIIKTSLTTTTNFCFNFFSEQILKEETVNYAMQLKMVIKRINPSSRFIEEREEVTEAGLDIKMFDFISYGMDEQLYNMMCLVPLRNGALQAIFNCLDRDSDEWKGIAWRAFLTIEEIAEDKKDT